MKRNVFNEEQEDELAAHRRSLDSYFNRLTSKYLRRSAFDFAVANKIKQQFNISSKLAGKDWIYS
jgi:hypothetical protein